MVTVYASGLWVTQYREAATSHTAIMLGVKPGRSPARTVSENGKAFREFATMLRRTIELDESRCAAAP
jgi:hypothetical protein